MTDPSDHELCASVVAAAVAAVDHIPITVKIRLQATEKETVDFATMLADAGVGGLFDDTTRHRFCCGCLFCF
jgi:tRNA-dihydrouridine synthase